MISNFSLQRKERCPLSDSRIGQRASCVACARQSERSARAQDEDSATARGLAEVVCQALPGNSISKPDARTACRRGLPSRLAAHARRTQGTRLDPSAPCAALGSPERSYASAPRTLKLSPAPTADRPSPRARAALRRCREPQHPRLHWARRSWGHHPGPSYPGPRHRHPPGSRALARPRSASPEQQQQQQQQP